MWINKKDEKLTITFGGGKSPKFYEILAAIKSIDGRKFNPRYKRWEVPIYHVEEVIAKLVPYGFNVHLDVVRLAKTENHVNEQIQKIKDTPQKYTGKLPLYGFQKQGVAFMKSILNPLLGDVPGLGKTIQTIAAVESHGSILVFCPASLKYNWAEEIKKWKPYASVEVVDGNKKARDKIWAGEIKAQYTISNYELLLRDFDLINKYPWSVIVCDEATRVSNPRAKTTKALKKLKAPKKIALTGTPISNTLEDIWSIVDWLYPGYLGDFFSFQEKYCVFAKLKDPTWKKIVGYKNVDELREKIDKIMIRRTKEEVFNDFPEKTTEDVVFELSEKEKDAYRAIRNQIWAELQKLKVEGHNLHIIPVKMLRLKQATNDLRLIAPSLPNEINSSKLEVLKDLLIPIVASGEKVIIFTQFAEMAKLLHSEFLRYCPRIIYGDIKPDERQEFVKQFNEDPLVKIMIMTEAGAYGLNLQAASYIVHYDQPWSVAKIEQRDGRAHRVGQKKAVTVYNLIGKNTIDQYVAKVLHKKKDLADQVLSYQDMINILDPNEEIS